MNEGSRIIDLRPGSGTATPDENVSTPPSVEAEPLELRQAIEDYDDDEPEPRRGRWIVPTTGKC